MLTGDATADPVCDKPYHHKINEAVIASQEPEYENIIFRTIKFKKLCKSRQGQT